MPKRKEKPFQNNKVKGIHDWKGPVNQNKEKLGQHMPGEVLYRPSGTQLQGELMTSGDPDFKEGKRAPSVSRLHSALPLPPSTLPRVIPQELSRYEVVRELEVMFLPLR